MLSLAELAEQVKVSKELENTVSFKKSHGFKLRKL
jgi:hypothetical protein